MPKVRGKLLLRLLLVASGIGVPAARAPSPGLRVDVPPAQPRRKKDRNAPKRPRNAYLVFLDRHRPAKHAANPQAAMKARRHRRSACLAVHAADLMPAQDLTCEMAKEWQLISKDETNAEKKICDGACPHHGCRGPPAR